MKNAVIIVAVLAGMCVATAAEAGPLRRLASRGKSVLGKVVKCVGGCR